MSLPLKYVMFRSLVFDSEIRHLSCAMFTKLYLHHDTNGHVVVYLSVTIEKPDLVMFKSKFIIIKFFIINKELLNHGKKHA